MAKDRAAPFSRKHRRIWLTVTGGMIVLGIVNVVVGLYCYAHSPHDAPRGAGDGGVPAWARFDGGAGDASPAQVER